MAHILVEYGCEKGGDVGQPATKNSSRLPVGWCVLLYGCGMFTLVTHAGSGELFVLGALFLVLTSAFVQSLRWMWLARRLEGDAGSELIGGALRAMTWALAVMLVLGSVL